MNYIIGKEDFELSPFWKEVFSNGSFFAGSFPLFLNAIQQRAKNSYILPEQYMPSDIDLFCYKEENFEKIMHLLYAELDQKGEEVQFAVNYDIPYPRRAAIDFKNHITEEIKNLIFTNPEHYFCIQLIKIVDTSRETILDNFDIFNCKIGYCEVNGVGKFMYPEGFYVNNDKLVVDEGAISNPYFTFNRMAKYAKRGFRIETTEHYKVMRAFSALSDEDKEKMQKENPYEFISSLSKKRHIVTVSPPVSKAEMDIEI